MKRSDPLVALLLTLLFCGGALLERPGTLPLDDVYIHLALAQTLVEEGAWGIPGHRWSAVSTAPYWTAALAAPMAFGFHAVTSALALSVLAHAALIFVTLQLAGELMRAFGIASPIWRYAAAICVAGAPPLLWSALSGMETLAAAALGTGALLAWWRGAPLAAVALAAPMGGLRPDGLLLPLVLFVLLPARAIAPRRIALAALFVALANLPWIALNCAVAGTPLPGTFEAKVGLYGAYRGPFLIALFVSYLAPPFWIGLVAFFLRDASERSSGESAPRGGEAPSIATAAKGPPRQLAPETKAEGWRLAPLWCWPPAHVLLFFALLPAPYHHQRYLAPVLPALLTLAVLGFALGFARARYGWALALGLVAFSAWQARGTLDAWRANRGDLRDLHVPAVALIASQPEPGGVLTDDLGLFAFALRGRPVTDLRGLADPRVNVARMGPDALREAVARAGFPVRFVALYPELYAGVEIPGEWHLSARLYTERSIAAASAMDLYAVDGE